jgi:hypothetical protein
MRKVSLGVLLLVFSACSQGAFAQGRGTGMLFLPQSDAPVILIETTHGVKDLLESAKLKDRSNLVITGYRIGWVAVYASGREKVGLGLPVDLPLGIRPGGTRCAGAERFNGLRQGRRNKHSIFRDGCSHL